MRDERTVVDAGARSSAKTTNLLVIKRWNRTALRCTTFVLEASALCLLLSQVVQVAEDVLRALVQDVLRRLALLVRQGSWRCGSTLQTWSGTMFDALEHMTASVLTLHRSSRKEGDERRG